MTKKFLIETFGCRLNQYESQKIREELQSIGYQESDKEVDLCLIHSCSVTFSAEKRVKNKIRFLCKKFPLARMVVFGCFAKRDPGAVQTIDPRVEVFTDKEKILPFLMGPQITGCEKKSISYFQGHTRAFVKIQDGCSSFCSYCIIPQLRGPSRSRPIEEILKEIDTLAQNGYQEIVLTGVNIGEYHYGLPALVRAIDKNPKIQRLRLSSLEPNHVNDDLLYALLEGRTTMPHLHLVLQSASNDILKKMNRPYTKELFLDKVQKIRKKKSDFCFTTDVIVGFPTETERDFLDTLSFVEQIGFAKVHIFPYSKRPKTKAERMEGQVAQSEKQKRREQLFQVAEEVAFRQREKFVGKRVEILLEGKGDEGLTPQFLPVKISSPQVKEENAKGKIVWVDIVENQKGYLWGKFL